MANGVRVSEPPVGPNQEVIDTTTVDYGGGDLRSRQVIDVPGLRDGTAKVLIQNYPGSQPITATSLPLPTGAAADTTLTSGAQKTQVTNFPATQVVSGTVSVGAAPHLNSATDSVTVVQSGTVTTDVSDRSGRLLGHVTVDSAASLPLPAGAATDASVSGLPGRYAGGKTAVVSTVSASGDTTLYTPTNGKSVRVFWISAQPDPMGSSSPLITVKLGATPIYGAYAVAHWEVFTGAVNAPLVVNLASGGTNVSITSHIQEI